MSKRHAGHTGRKFVAELALELMRGAETADILKSVEDRFPLNGDEKERRTSINGRHAALCQIRAAVLSKGRLPTYDDTGLRAFEKERAVEHFLNAGLKEQWKVQRAFIRDPEMCAFSKEAQKELARIELVPPAMHTLFMSKRQALERKQLSAEALVKKNGSLLVVEKGALLVRAAPGTARPHDQIGGVITGCCVNGLATER